MFYCITWNCFLMSGQVPKHFFKTYQRNNMLTDLPCLGWILCGFFTRRLEKQLHFVAKKAGEIHHFRWKKVRFFNSYWWKPWRIFEYSKFLLPFELLFRGIKTISKLSVDLILNPVYKIQRLPLKAFRKMLLFLPPT